ncbi:MAG: hypothetical protein M3Y09_16395, partial [Actinomycetota bacterium]|nr:hypothetical protein [Actinomycetota bacterium]
RAPRRPPPAATPVPAAVASRTAPRSTALPVDASPRRRRRLPLIPIALLALTAAAVIGAVTLTSEGSDPSHPPISAHAQTKPRARANPRATATSSTTSTGASSPPTKSASSSSATTSAAKTSAAAALLSGSPAAAASTFYTLAAGHHFPQAWALADLTFQSQLGGYQSFQNTFAADRLITIDSLRTLDRSAGSATVALTTTSVRTDGTQHCTGTVQLSPAASKGGWLMHHIQVACQ